MSLSFHNPWALILAAILVAAVSFAALKLKKKPEDKVTLRAANTARLKANPLYRRRLIEARIFRILSIASTLFS